MSNLYYNPEDFDLELVTEHELDDEAYQFNVVAVWRNKSTGQLLWATDSGCSCPSPFEDYSELAQLEPLNVKQAEGLVRSCANRTGAMDFIRRLYELTTRCPKCEENPLVPGDYLCEPCRYGG